MSIRLEIEPEFLEVLRAGGLTTFREFMEARTERAVSEHKVRSTAPLELRIDGGVRRFYLKRNHCVPFQHSIMPLLRGHGGYSQPRREWEVLGRLSRAGIPAMKRVACGERGLAGVPLEAFLLVEEVPMAHTLEDWLVPGFAKPERLSVEQRVGLYESVGRLLRQIHDAGLKWPDAHPKHIFAQRDAGGGWDVCVIDVERMEEAPSSEDENVIEFIGTLRPLALTGDELRSLYRGYGAELPAGCIPSGPRLPDDYEHPRTVRITFSDTMMRDERAIGLLQGAGLNSLDDVFRFEAPESLTKEGLKRHRDRSRIELRNGDGRGRTCYLKRYRCPPFMEQVRRIREAGAGQSTATREARAARKLNEIGIPTMKVIAYGEEMRGPWERRSFALTEGIDGPSLERTLVDARGESSRLPAWPVRREIIRQLALIARLLHDHGLFHRDFYLSHVLMTHNEDGGVVLRVIDLARLLERPLRRQRWRIKDLAALNHSAWAPLVTRADRIRFLKLYLGPEATGEVLRRDIAAIMARTEKMRRHDLNSAGQGPRA